MAIRKDLKMGKQRPNNAEFKQALRNMRQGRPDLIRPQPSLGEKAVDTGIKEGVGIFKWLIDRRGKKKLAERLQVLEDRQNWLASDFVHFKKDHDNRLKEIEKRVDQNWEQIKRMCRQKD